MIKNLLLGKSGRLQLLIVMIGSFIGLSLVMVSLQLYQDFKSVLTVKSDLLSAQIITVNKRVNVLNTVFNSKSTFSAEEIEDLSKQKDIKKVGAFTSNVFRLKTSIDFAGQIIYSDLFFESVPEDFLDIKPEDWGWNPDSKIIPIILPADYLSLYNFGFAPGQGLPQITPDMVSMATLNIVITGADRQENFKGRIVGFSNRINSILVPQEFMEYANDAFGDKQKREPSRLIVLSDNPAAPDLIKYFNDNSYDVNDEMLKNSRLQSVLRIIVSIVLLLSIIIITLSLTGFVQYARLLINKKEYEIRNLYYLGYSHKSIYQKYIRFYFTLSSLVFVIAIIALFISKYFFTSWMVGKGYEVGSAIHYSSVTGGVILFILLLITGCVDIYFTTRKLAR